MDNPFMNKNEIILDKHSSMIQMSNKVSSIQRKAFNILVFNAKKQIENHTNFEFTISIRHILDLVGLEKSENHTIIKKLLQEMRKIDVEYNLLGKDKKNEWGQFSLLAGISIKNGIVSYSFPHQILKMIINPAIFTKINLAIIKGLTSKYSIALYKICEDYKKINRH